MTFHVAPIDGSRKHTNVHIEGLYTDNNCAKCNDPLFKNDRFAEDGYPVLCLKEGKEILFFHCGCTHGFPQCKTCSGKYRNPEYHESCHVCYPCGKRIVIGEEVRETAFNTNTHTSCSWVCPDCEKCFPIPTPLIDHPDSELTFILTCTEEHGCVQRPCKTCKGRLENGYYMGPIMCQPTMCVQTMSRILEYGGKQSFRCDDTGIYGENEEATKIIWDVMCRILNRKY